MTTKLTLSVEKAIIERAKRYAAKHDRSLSDIVAKYLAYLTGGDTLEDDIDPEVLDLSDEISPEELLRVDDARFRYLSEKYLDA